MAEKNPSSRSYTPQGGLSTAASRDILPFAAPTTRTWGEALTRLLPIAGDAWGIQDAKQEYAKGNKKTAAAIGGLSAAGLGGYAPLLSGIFVGKNGAMRAALQGNPRINESQLLAKKLRDAELQDGHYTWDDLPLDSRHMIDKEIWRRTHAETGYPSSVNFPDGHIQTEIDDSIAQFTPFGGQETGKNFGELTKGPLKGFLKHPEANFLYPDLMNERLSITHPDNLPNGVVAERGEDYYNLNAKHIQPAEAKGSVLHELQHGIDRQEGMGTGANAQYFAALLNQIKGPRDEYLNAMAAMREHGVKYTDDAFKGLEKAMRDEIEPIFRKVGSWNPVSAYTRTAGEAKARLVDARKDLPMKERARVYPLDFKGDIPIEDYRKVFDVPPMLQWVRTGKQELRDKWRAQPDFPDSEFVRQKNGTYRHEDDGGSLDNSGWDDEPSKWADGGLVPDDKQLETLLDSLTKEQMEELLIELEPDAPERFADGGLVLDPAKGLLTQGMNLVNPTNKHSAPLDIPLNTNNMLAHHRAGTPQGQLYRTR